MIQLNAGGSFTQTGGTLVYNTFDMDGGTVNGTLTNGGTFNYAAGTFNGRLVNAVGSSANFEEDFTAGNGMANATALSMGSNRTVTLNGAGLANTGTIVLQGGVLAGSGPLVNSGTLAGFGVIAGSGGFTNAGTWEVTAGDLHITNTGPVVNSAGLTVAASLTGLSLVLDGAGVRLENAGTVVLNANAEIAGTGALVNAPAGVIHARGATIGASFTNQGRLNVGNLGLGDVNVVKPMVNSGSIVISGVGSVLGGATITNTGTIGGAGQVNNAIVNTGTISPAVGGLLNLDGSVHNQAGGVLSVGAGSTLSANVSTNAGTITVAAGGTFNDGAFVNTGQVNVSGTLDVDGITNTGTIALSGGLGTIDVFGPIANLAGGNVSAAGGANAVFYDNLTHAPGAGLSVAAGATASFVGNVTGGGAVGNSGAVNLSAGKTYVLGEVSGGGTMTLFEGAQLTATRITQGTLALNSLLNVGSLVTIAPAATPGVVTSKVNSLSLAGGVLPTARFDLANTNLVVDYALLSPIAAVREQIRAGFNPLGAPWSGSGITSSSAAATGGRTALGFAEASELLGLSGGATADWHGQTVDATSVLIGYTLAGDATLNGGVDFDDLVRLAQNYNDTSGNRFWYDGDFDYDGSVDFNDLVKLAQNYNTALASAAVPAAIAGDWAAALASVPEPGVLAAAVLLPLCGRRRRRGYNSAR